jgi:hypothetical protein
MDVNAYEGVSSREQFSYFGKPFFPNHELPWVEVFALSTHSLSQDLYFWYLWLSSLSLGISDEVQTQSSSSMETSVSKTLMDGKDCSFFFPPCPTSVDLSETCTQHVLHGRNAFRTIEYLTSLLARIFVVGEKMTMLS